MYKIFEYKAAGRVIVYFDESYVTANHMPSMLMVDTTVGGSKDAEERELTTGV